MDDRFLIFAKYETGVPPIKFIQSIGAASKGKFPFGSFIISKIVVN